MQYFPFPDHKLKFYKVDNEENLIKKYHLFSSVPFHAVCIFLPSYENFLEDFKELMVSDENCYFIVKDIPVSALLNQTLLENFIKNGTFCAVSHNSENDVDNLITITQSGKLIINLENNLASYLSLLKEKLSHRHQKSKLVQTHQVCIIDIGSHDFMPDKKFYRSVVSELKKIDHIKFNLLLKWKPKGNICSESIREYFESQSIECVPCEPCYKQETSFNIPFPKVNFNTMDQDSIENILEWTGAQICGVKYANKEDEFVSKFFAPEPSQELRRLHMGSCFGFYIAEEVQTVLKNVKKFFMKDSKLPFVIIAISGYQHCYVDSKDVGKVSSDDKLICILVIPQLNYWVIELNI